MRSFKLVLYYALASKLPSSWWPGGRLFNSFRIWCLTDLVEIGSNNKIQKGVYIGKGRNVRVGNNCQINEYARLDNVRVGNNVMVARESVILGKMHETSESSRPMNQQGNRELEPTIIEDDVWLGLRVIVMPGLTISRGCIIGAGSVLTKSTEPYGVYGGVPARLIRKRKSD